jgi:ribonuclease HI
MRKTINLKIINIIQKIQMFPQIKLNNKTTIKINPDFHFKMNFDGCSKGNPGLSGAGAVIYSDDDEIWNGQIFVGEKFTNNHAEYAGLILGLQEATKLNIKNILVEGDSLLVINQMKGIYNCNSHNLIELFDKAKELETNFEKIHYQHIDRKFNKRADQLSNIAVMDYILLNK